MAVVPISTTQTDAGSPLNEDLMEKLRQRSTYVPIGTVIWQHSFNGLIDPPEGYMKCNGDICNEANYNAIHGAGSWDDEVGSSDLDGKYLPDLIGNYAVGASATTQAGTSSITTVGNTDHETNIEHNHQWYNSITSSSTSDQSYNSSGNALNFTQGTPKDGAHYCMDVTVSQIPLAADMYTAKDGSTTQDIQPESVELIPWIKII